MQTILLHTMRAELDELNQYHLLLQEQGLLTDEIYFNCSSSEVNENCQWSFPNDCGRFIGFTSHYSI